MSTAALAAVIQHDITRMGNVNLTFMGTRGEMRELAPRAADFMHASLPAVGYDAFTPHSRCRLAGCRLGTRILKPRKASGGLHAMEALFSRYGCSSVGLYGFNDPDTGRWPYHYWKDGSYHDGVTSSNFYRRKFEEDLLGHDFAAEHWFFFHVLGQASWRCAICMGMHT